MDKLWNLSETADTPVRWPGLLGKGGGIPAAQQPGRPLWCWWEGQGALGRRKLQILWLGGHVPCLLPQGPSVLCMLGALLRAHRSAQKTPTSSEQLLTASHWPDPVSSQASLPQETPPPTRAAQDLAWCKSSPSSTPHRPCPEARLPLHAHLPLHVSSPPGWGQSHVSGAQLRSDPWRAPASISGRNKAPPSWVLHPHARVGLPPANDLRSTGPSQVLSRGLWTPPRPPPDCPKFGPHGTLGRTSLLSPSTVPHSPPGRAPLTLQRSRDSRPPSGDRFKARRLPLPPLQDPRSSTGAGPPRAWMPQTPLAR